MKSAWHLRYYIATFRNGGARAVWQEVQGSLRDEWVAFRKDIARRAVSRGESRRRQQARKALKHVLRHMVGSFVLVGDGQDFARGLTTLATAFSAYRNPREVAEDNPVILWDLVVTLLAERMKYSSEGWLKSSDTNGYRAVLTLCGTRVVTKPDDVTGSRKANSGYAGLLRDYKHAHPKLPVPSELDPDVLKEHVDRIVQLLQVAGYPVTFAGAR